MEINDFLLYSKTSDECQNENKTYKEVEELVKRFDSFNDKSAAKAFLKDELDITEICFDHPVCQNGLINCEEHGNVFSVEIIYKNNNYIYCYNK